MSDPVNALGGARFDGLVSITELPPQGMITLRGDLSDIKFDTAAKTVGGGTLPAQRRAEIHGARGLLWMSPDELLVLCPYAEVGQSLDTLHDPVNALGGRACAGGGCLGRAGKFRAARRRGARGAGQAVSCGPLARRAAGG